MNNVKFVPKYADDTPDQKVARQIIKAIRKDLHQRGESYDDWDEGLNVGLKSAIRIIQREYQIED